MSSWRQSGLIPFCPKIALCKIHSATPEPALPSLLATTITTATRQLIKTPTTVQSTRRLAIELLSQSVGGKKLNQHKFHKFVRGALVNTTLRQVAEQEVEHLQAATIARQNRQKAGRKVVQKGGVIYASNARLAINKRAENEAEKAERAAAKRERDAVKQASQGQTQATGSQTL